MNRREAGKLLGGYATGTLTESERATLFSAALDHQELFDALMDEEALRELLADPVARQRVLTVLAPAAAHKVPRLWRRPAFIGLAASLFALVTTSLVVLRRPDAQPPSVAQNEASDLSLGQEANRQDKAEAVALGDAARALPSPMPAKSKKSSSSLDQAKASPLKTASTTTRSLEVEREEDKPAEFLENVAKPASTAAVSAEPPAAVRKDSRAAKQTKGSLAACAEASPIECTLEHLEGGRVRVKVTWGIDGYLYVLKRTPAGAIVVVTENAVSQKPGKRVNIFELTLGEKDALDVYVLREPEARPEALPAAGAIQGERRRLFPE